jgi:hypothetical protein
MVLAPKVHNPPIPPRAIVVTALGAEQLDAREILNTIGLLDFRKTHRAARHAR